MSTKANEALASLNAPNAQSLKPYANAVGSLKQLEDVAGSAKAASIKYFQKLAWLNGKIQRQSKDYASHLTVAGIGGKEFNAKMSAYTTQLRKQFGEESREERAKIYAPVVQAQKSIAAIKADGLNPKALATAYRVTDPARAAIWQMVSSMGQGSLAALARQAAAEKGTEQGKMLAACLILRNDNMHPNSRTFSSDELASICFEQAAEINRSHISTIEELAASVQAVDQAWTSNKPIPPNTKIALGLSFPDINLSAVLDGENSEAASEALSALQRIAANLPGSATDSGKETAVQEFARLKREAEARMAADDAKTPEQREEEWQALLASAAA